MDPKCPRCGQLEWYRLGHRIAAGIAGAECTEGWAGVDDSDWTCGRCKVSVRRPSPLQEELDKISASAAPLL